MITTEYTEEINEFGSDESATLRPGVICVLMENGIPHAVNFLCPCGCGSECYTRVVPQGKARPDNHTWTYGPGPTLEPSIHYMGGCKAHFTITGGKVTIHPDSGK